jgi:hypothetical protein
MKRGNLSSDGNILILSKSRSGIDIPTNMMAHRLALPMISKGRQKLKIPASKYNATEMEIGVSE